MKTKLLLFTVILFISQINFSGAQNLRIINQTTGPLAVNCYLIYDYKSRDAALIDPGWEIDTLLSYIKDSSLNVKFIFITHGHIDHLYYVPKLKTIFPGAKTCMNKIDYEDLSTIMEWIKNNYGQKWIDEAMSNPDTKKYMEFDMRSFETPDIFLEENQSFLLGSVEFKTILSPGHSRGSICFYTGNILFPGDVLFYRKVGTYFTQHGSKSDLIKSVRRLYEMFPDSTVVYPGHGQFTDIGSEKTMNKYITADSVYYKK